VPGPAGWAGGALRLSIRAGNTTHYTFSAGPAANATAAIVIGSASAELVSGKDNGSFVGSLVGAYATCNGAGSGEACPQGGNAYFQRWRYTGVAQQLSATELVPSADMARGGA